MHVYDKETMCVTVTRDYKSPTLHVVLTDS